MADPILATSELTRRFGGLTAVDRVSLELARNGIHALIGPNGAGKSTLVNCSAGTLRNDAGSIRFLDRDICRDPAFKRVHQGLARTFQIPRFFASMSVVDNLRIPLLYGQRAPVTMDAGRVTEEAMAILAQVGLAAKALANSRGLTQVDMRKLELARAIAAKPRLLISDEAMAGLSSSEVDEILELLLGMKERGVAVIMIEHVMRAVMRFSERIAVLVAGRKIADGEPKAVVAQPDVVTAYLGQ